VQRTEAEPERQEPHTEKVTALEAQKVKQTSGKQDQGRKELQKEPRKGIPISRADELFPEGEHWEQRWEQEPEEDFKERTKRSRLECINRFGLVWVKLVDKPF
jgi:hypothetical protein